MLQQMFGSDVMVVCHDLHLWWCVCVCVCAHACTACTLAFVSVFPNVVSVFWCSSVCTTCIHLSMALNDSVCMCA